jgi:Uma2 family endonuclease
MPTLITDREMEQRLQAARHAVGADRYDEVWEGTYMMAPMPNDEHQQLVNRFAAIFQDVIDWPELGHVRPGVNVSDRIENWQENYRVPDVAVFLNGGQAVNQGAFWYGGPDFAIEVVSPDDRTLEKLPFYAAVHVREVLVVHRQPWRLELLKLRDGRLVTHADVTESAGKVVVSGVLPFSFRLVPGTGRPQIEVIHVDSHRQWLV